MYKNLKNIYTDVVSNRKIKSLYNSMSKNKGLIAATIGMLLIAKQNPRRIDNQKSRKIDNQTVNNNLFINRSILDSNEKMTEVYSDFSSSSYKSSVRELTEEDMSEIISIVDEDKNLDKDTKKIIKVNAAILLLIQRQRR